MRPFLVAGSCSLVSLLSHTTLSAASINEGYIQNHDYKSLFCLSKISDN